jgi:hypothetical protein
VSYIHFLPVLTFNLAVNIHQVTPDLLFTLNNIDTLQLLYVLHVNIFKSIVMSGTLVSMVILMPRKHKRSKPLYFYTLVIISLMFTIFKKLYI